MMGGWIREGRNLWQGNHLENCARIQQEMTKGWEKVKAIQIEKM